MKNAMLQMDQMVVGYHQKQVIAAPVLHASSGQLVGVVGKNGSGKTTLFKSILGQLPLMDGRLILHGKDIQKLAPKELARMVAVVYSRLDNVPEITVYQLLALGRYPYHGLQIQLKTDEKTLIEQIAHDLRIAHLLPKKCTELSDGQLQLVMIGRALVQNTPLLLMDEPTSHLDFENQLLVLKYIADCAQLQSKTVLFSSHHIAQLMQFVDWLWWVHDGQVEEGMPEDLAYRGEILTDFTSQSLCFNPQLNRYVTEKTYHRQVRVEGEGMLHYWLCNALERNGLQIDTGNDLPLITIENQRIQYQHGEETRNFESIAEVVGWLGG